MAGGVIRDIAATQPAATIERTELLAMCLLLLRQKKTQKVAQIEIS
jgi:hypothetical protein